MASFAARPSPTTPTTTFAINGSRQSLLAAGIAASAASGESAPQGTDVYSLSGPLTVPQAGDPEDIARRFLSRVPGPRRHSPAASGTEPDLVLIGRSRSPRIGLTHLTFQQEYQGIPLFDSELRVHLDDQGRIWRFSRPQPLPAAPSEANIRLTAGQALKAALESLLGGDALPAVTTSVEDGPQRRTLFASPALKSPATVSLTWFPLAGAALPAWQMYLDLGGAGAYWVVLDAADGRLLYSRSLIRRERPTGLVFRAPDRANPLRGPQSSEPWAGWPASYGDCPGDIYPMQFRAGSQSGRCWVRAQQTEGNNADACLDADGDNLCDARAVASQDRFAFPFEDAFDRDDDPAPDRNAALANAFYWTNVLHDWLYRLGFDEAAGNFQADNFGRGGEAGDPVRLDLQDPAVLNNATFTTTPDGIAPRMELGLFSGLRRDTAFDADILTHEYIHGLTTRLIGGPASANGLSLWQSGAMGEGWSDAYAASLTGDPVLGEYASRNPATGIRTVAYDNSPYTFGMFGTLRTTVIANSGGLLLGLPQVHQDGEIWATVLWEVRQTLGRDEFERVLTAALSLTPRRPSMLDARDAILQAAQAAGAGGTGDCDVWAVFAARGFGYSAALNPVQSGQANDTALSVFESFDLPAACGGAPPAPGTVLLQEDAESASTAWTPVGLWHRSSRRAASGGFSWWYGRDDTATYDTGGRNRGSLTSPPLDLGDSSGALLEWDQFLRTEGFNHPMDIAGTSGPYLNADSGRVLVSTDGGSSWRVLTHIAHPTPGDGFAHYRVNLSRFAGQNLRLQFEFDTFDSKDNDHEGWFLDNIRVSRLGPEPARIEVSPGALHFSGVAGGPTPAAQTVRVSTHEGSTQGGPQQGDNGPGLVWTAAVLPGAPWLSLLPASGAGASQVQVSATAFGLDPGLYHGAIRFYELNRPERITTIVVDLLVEPAAGPEATWSFEEQGRGPGILLADGSGHGHAASTSGAGSDIAPGVAGSARIFDGATGYAKAASSVDFSPPRLTLRTWVKLKDDPGTLGVIAAALGNDAAPGWFVGVLGSGNVALMVRGPAGEALWLVSRGVLPVGEWHSITVTLDRPVGEAALYIDGELDDSARFAPDAGGGAQPLTIGRASWWDGYYLSFVIDETLLDSRVWTAADVRADAGTFSPPAADGLAKPVAYWRFEATATGAGAALADDLGRHDAIVQGEGSRPVPGVQGSARAFGPPAGFAQVPADSDFASASFTFSTWIELDSYPLDWGVVFSDFDGDYRGWFAGINSDGRVIVSVWGRPSFATWVLSDRRLEIGPWHHLAVSFDGLSQRVVLYIDGEADRSFFVDVFTPQSEVGPTFARASWFDGYALGCALDETKLFTAALPAREIRGEYERLGEAPLGAAGVSRR